MFVQAGTANSKRCFKCKLDQFEVSLIQSYVCVQNNKIENAKGQGHQNINEKNIYYFPFTILMSI